MPTKALGRLVNTRRQQMVLIHKCDMYTIHRHYLWPNVPHTDIMPLSVDHFVMLGHTFIKPYLRFSCDICEIYTSIEHIDEYIYQLVADILVLHLLMSYV